jgi:hypothetical protein
MMITDPTAFRAAAEASTRSAAAFFAAYLPTAG